RGIIGKIIDACAEDVAAVIIDRFGAGQYLQTMPAPGIVVGEGIGPVPGAVVTRSFLESIRAVVLGILVGMVGVLIVVIVVDRTTETGPDRKVFQEIRFSPNIAEYIPVVTPVVARPQLVSHGVGGVS